MFYLYIYTNIYTLCNHIYKIVYQIQNPILYTSISILYDYGAIVDVKFFYDFLK